jgi:hypothetical protein
MTLMSFQRRESRLFINKCIRQILQVKCSILVNQHLHHLTLEGSGKKTLTGTILYFQHMIYRTINRLLELLMIRASIHIRLEVILISNSIKRWIRSSIVFIQVHTLTTNSTNQQLSMTACRKQRHFLISSVEEVT